MAKFRSLKADLRHQLMADDWQDNLIAIAALPGKETVGPLMSFLLFGGEMKWRAATALGLCVAALADENMEQARVVMRRLLWHMNEESGNIGWGIPEAMAECMANHSRLADEYNRMLHSYVRETSEDDNYLDHGPLRAAVYWGLGRLAQVRPELVRPAERALWWGLEDEHHAGRGTAAWALGILQAHGTAGRIRTLLGDTTPVEIFEDRKTACATVGQLARQALERMGEPADAGPRDGTETFSASFS